MVSSRCRINKFQPDIALLIVDLSENELYISLRETGVLSIDYLGTNNGCREGESGDGNQQQLTMPLFPEHLLQIRKK